MSANPALARHRERASYLWMNFAMRKFDLLPILLLAISSNGDNVAVGVAYGLGRIGVPLSSNLLIAAVTGAGTLASVWLGQAIACTLDARLASVVGGLVIIAIGGWVVVQATRSRLRGQHARKVQENRVGALGRLIQVLNNPVSADRDFSRRIEVKESWMLAVALSLNNAANGVAAGMLRMNPVFTTLFVMVFSVLTLSAGLAVGYQAGKRWLGSLSGILSGLLLVALGLYEIRV
jgi:putative sporulation protein YtaF